MARTIQRLEHRLEWMKDRLEAVLDGFNDGVTFKEMSQRVAKWLKEDMESAR